MSKPTIGEIKRRYPALVELVRGDGDLAYRASIELLTLWGVFDPPDESAELKRLRVIEAAVKSVDWGPAYEVVTALLEACEEQDEEQDAYGMDEYIRWCAALLRQEDDGAVFADRLDAIADELGANT